MAFTPHGLRPPPPAGSKKQPRGGGPGRLITPAVPLPRIIAFCRLYGNQERRGEAQYPTRRPRMAPDGSQTLSAVQPPSSSPDAPTPHLNGLTAVSQHPAASGAMMDETPGPTRGLQPLPQTRVAPIPRRNGPGSGGS
jgi:hypothetical protein